MLISNRDKHIVENEVRTRGAGDVLGLHADGTPHPKPIILGDKLFVAAGREPHIYSLPHYYFPYDMFAVKGGKWMIFWIIIEGAKLGLMRFLEDTPKKVEHLIKGLETCM
jgi:hypothetical protein